MGNEEQQRQQQQQFKSLRVKRRSSHKIRKSSSRRFCYLSFKVDNHRIWKNLCPEVKGPDGNNSAGGLQVSSARKPTMPEPGILIATCMSINREQLFNVMGIVRKVFDVFPESGLAKRPRNFFFVPESGLRLLAGKPAAGPA